MARSGWACSPGWTRRRRIQRSFAALGPSGQALFQQLMGVIKTSLATAIMDLFLVGAVTMVVGLIATLFLPEIPLRSVRQTAPAVGAVEDELANVGIEMAPNVWPEGPEQRARGTRAG